VSEQFANQRVATTLNGALAQGALTATVTSGDGLPEGGTFRIVVGTGALAEIVIVGDRTDTTLTGLIRGAEGTTDRAWVNHSAVSHILTAASLEAGISDGVIAGVDTHAAASDPHPIYDTSAEAQVKVDAHAAAADPHTIYQKESERAQPSGYASLDSSGKVPSSQVPAIALSDTFVVASEAAMVALTAQVGDIAVRTDLSESFILTIAPATLAANWQELLAPADAVQSVNGNTGTVLLDASDVGAETPAGAQTKVDLHVNDPTGAHAATAVAFTPTGTVAASDVQAAIAEVASESAHPNLATHDSLGLATDTELTSHRDTTTSIHGITDTSVLETTTGSQAKVDTHTVAGDPHGDRAYADTIQQGLDVKDAVVAATTANVTLSGPQTLDGYGVIAGDRVLVKNQTTGSQNGIYVVSNSAWTRATDADSDAEVNPGMFCFVTQGTTQSATGWVLTTAEPITVGTTALAFNQFSGSGQITAGGGLTKTGNTLDIVGDSSVVVSADSISVATVHAGSSHAATETAAEATAAADATSKVSAHEADTTSIHGITNTANLETASGAQTKVDTHVNDITAAHAASSVGFTPTGSIAATDVQAAIAEAASEGLALGASPSTQALGDSAAGGSASTASKNDHKHGLPALGTTAAAIGTSAGGSAATPSKSDHVHATGAGTPSTQAFGDSAATGSGPAGAMTDHKHAMPSERAASSSTPAAVGTAATGTGTTDARSDHIHATGAGTPSTQAFADTAATGSGPAASMTDHKHAMPAAPVTSIAKTGSAALTGAVTITQGSNVSLTQSGNDISITSLGGTDTAAVHQRGSKSAEDDYGAVGDNSTANDTAFSNAMAAMATGTGPHTLLIGTGTFRFSNDLVIPNIDGLTIQGRGRTATTLSFATGKGIKTAQTALVQYAKIADLWVAQIGTAGTGIGIDYSGVARSVIERCRMTSFATGIKCSDATNQFDSHHNIIYDPIMSSCTNGIELTGSPTHCANDGEIYGGDISQCTVGILVSGAAVNGWQMHGTSLESNTTALDIYGFQNYFHPRFEGNTTDINFRSGSHSNKVRTAFANTAKITDSTTASSIGTNEIEVDGFQTSPHTSHPKEFVQTFDAFQVPSTAGGDTGALVCEAANQGYFVRVLPQRYHKVTALAIVPITSVGNVDVGILEAYASSTEAGTLLASSGSTAMSGTGNSTQTLTLDSTVYMVPGRQYFFAVAFDTIDAVIYGSRLDLVNLAAKRATIVEGHQRSDTKASMFPLSGKTFTSLGFTGRIPWIAAKT
jgi:hypothetical protein